jgi:Domain of unknown function (DUF4832)/Domain of unknown function (DUF4874)
MQQGETTPAEVMKVMRAILTLLLGGVMMWPPAAQVVTRGAPVVDAEYEPLNDPHLLNPERGIYYWTPMPDDPHTLVAQWLYLGTHCAKELAWKGHNKKGTSQLLNDYAGKLVAHREAGRKVIFRPRYDTPDKEGELNDCKVFQAKSEQRMRRHVKAIASMLAEFKDVVAFVEAGYLGRWGEWHWSGYEAKNAPVLSHPDQRRAFLAYVIDTYRGAGLHRYVEVRRPLFAKEMFDTHPKQSPFIGYYNDCFMTNATEQGTYSTNFADEPDIFPSEDAAINWLKAKSLEVPFGGETCGVPADKPRWASCANMTGGQSEPAALHMSYLHAGFAEEAKSTWVKGGCYDEIKSRLGYRFEVVSVSYQPQAAAGTPVTVSVRLKNAGWARMHNPRRAYFILRGPGGAYAVGGNLTGYQMLPASQTSGENVAGWMPGTEAVFEQTFTPPPGVWELGVMLPDPDKPGLKAYAVRFATVRKGKPGGPLYDQPTGVNALRLSLTVK